MKEPTLVTPKVASIEAMQFTGGPASASDITMWLDRSLGAESRRGAIAIQFVPALEEVIENDVVTTLGEPEHLAIFSIGGRLEADVDDWIIRDDVSIVKIVKANYFAELYDTVKVNG